MKVLETQVACSTDDVTITFIVDTCPSSQDLEPLWMPPSGEVYRQLLKAKFIAPDATILKHFRGDAVAPEAISGGRYQVVFHYYLVHDKN